MRGFQTKVYMVQVKPKILASLQNILNGSAADSENLIVNLQELNSTLCELIEANVVNQFIKDILEDTKDKAEYIWFYL